MNHILSFIMGIISLVGGMLFILLIIIPAVLWLFLRNRNEPWFGWDDAEIDHFMFDGREKIEKSRYEFFIK